MNYDLQRADMWKRISAWIFDRILVFILAVGFAFLLSFAFDFNSHIETYEARQAHFSETYGITLGLAEEEYAKLSLDAKAVYDKATDAFNKDGEASYAVYMMFNYALIIVTFSILLAYLALEYAVPLLFKNGQTLGKKIFGIAVMRMDGVKVSPLVMFIRTVLGKYTVETMIPVLILIGVGFGVIGIVGICVAIIIILSNFIAVIVTKTHSPIHDVLSSTVTVDMATQLIFDTPEALLEHKKKLHEEMVENSEYK